MFNHLTEPPKREYAIFGLIVVGFVLSWIFNNPLILGFLSFVGSLPTLSGAYMELKKKRLSIDVFNYFAMVVCFITGEFPSAAFIVLMLAFARLLEWKTESRMTDAVKELLDQKPKTANRENGTVVDVIPIEDVRKGDNLIVKAGESIPVDGVVVFGKTEVNESLITGESLPVEKLIGDEVLASTINITNVIKMQATRVGKDSTLEQMARLIRDAQRHKSDAQKLADVFASYFFPVVLVGGLLTYIFTRSTQMVAALFLVACADDMAVAIPLAVTATLGQAAKRGIVIRGGKFIEPLAKVKTIVLDKTGTLTYGKFFVKEIHREEGINEEDFWTAIAIAEKYSEHPIGKALFHEAIKKVSVVPNALKYQVYKGAGVYARYGKDDIVVGTIDILKEHEAVFPRGLQKRVQEKFSESAGSIIFVAINKIFVGYLVILDAPREGVKESIEKLRVLGVEKILILTGDKQAAAAYMAETVGITEYYAELYPEDKVAHIKELLKNHGPLVMIGDGVNDAPALALADVGIAMGKGGSAITAHTADVVFLNDNLIELPALIELCRRSRKVIYTDMITWFVTNFIGFALVFSGFLTPARAALYNFLGDFAPILNSSSLFVKGKQKIKKTLKKV
jgi:heavy metal translocating P-type ATPase